jgi:hypothetical protein
MMKPETSKLEDQRRLAEMERRLEAIEKAVGATPDKMVRIPFYFEFVRSLHFTFLNMRKTIFLILILKLGKHEFCNLNAFIFSLR